MTYFCSPSAPASNAHLVPVGYPAPPRPRNPEALISSTTSSGVMVVMAFASDR